jgi:hypothetical protein
MRFETRAGDGLDERRQTLKVTHYRRQRERTDKILQTLEAIRQSLE